MNYYASVAALLVTALLPPGEVVRAFIADPGRSVPTLHSRENMI
jgi:hypothetical protein